MSLAAAVSLSYRPFKAQSKLGEQDEKMDIRGFAGHGIGSGRFLGERGQGYESAHLSPADGR